MKNVITSAFDVAIKRHGFIKKRGTWYRDSSESIGVAQLQKSNYGPTYYVNVAVWPKYFGDEEAPKVELCPFQVRLGSLAKPAEVAAFDMTEIEYTNDARTEIIARCVDDIIIPFLRSIETIHELKSLIVSNTIPGAAVFLRLRESLGIE